MAEPTIEQLEAALARHASGAGEVFPSAVEVDRGGAPLVRSTMGCARTAGDGCRDPALRRRR